MIFSLIVRAIMNVLTTLEGKISQVVSLCGQLRAENNALKKELQESKQQTRTVIEKMDLARTRLEAFALSLPAEEE